MILSFNIGPQDSSVLFFCLANIFYIMNSQFSAAINQICSEKNISKESVMTAIQAALVTAYRKDYGNKEQEVEIIFGEENTHPTVFLIKEVVDEVENDNYEITLKEARKFKKDAEEGDEVKIDVTPVGYGRIAAQAAKQVIIQRIQEAEKEALYTMFKDREDQLLTAIVSRVEGSGVYLSIEKNTVLLTQANQISGEQYYVGKRLRVYLDKVKKTSKGPQLLISRTHKNLVLKLLEQEIPEIGDGEVEVVSIARDAGQRTKVAVRSVDSKIDAIGACVGQKGSRIQVIMDELNGERVDIIEYTEDDNEFIKKALQPAKISEIVVVNDAAWEDEDTGRIIKKRAAVFVEEDQRPMAVGRGGQNVRLASDLTDFELDMYNIEELPAFKEKLEELQGEGE